MVHFSPCRAVLPPFLVLVVEPALLAPEWEVVFFPVLFFLLCIVIHICFYSVFFLILLWVLQGTSFYGDFRCDERHDFLLDSFLSPFVQTLSLAGLVPRQPVLPGIRKDRHCVACPCLPRTRNPPALQLQHSLLLQNCCFVPWFGTGCCKHLPPTLP